MQMAWEAEQAAILALADDAKARLALAESAKNAGLIRKAVVLYTRVAADKYAPEQAAAARQALVALQDEVRSKFDDIETRLANGLSTARSTQPAPSTKPTTGSKPTPSGSTASTAPRPSHPEAIPIPGLDDTPAPGPGDPPSAATPQAALPRPAAGEDPESSLSRHVASCFDEFDKLLWEYDDVPRVGRELRARLNKLRRSPQYALVLNEPEAARLWQLAQKHEKEQQSCCAFLVYEQAIKLTPAPSAEKARKRLTALKQDQQQVAAAERCRHLRACHKTFERAERLTKVAPDKAKELLAEVVASAPNDSELYRVARERLHTLSTGGA
ncbi:MAG: hypothetical protein AB7O68_17095 [Pirellulales bacterium]